MATIEQGDSIFIRTPSSGYEVVKMDYINKRAIVRANEHGELMFVPFRQILEAKKAKKG